MNSSPSSGALPQTLLCFVCAFLCESGLAQDAMVRASLATNDTIWAGQKATLVVELLAPGFFAGAATFDLPDPQGVLLMPPMEHPIVSSETIGGVSYTVQQHELSVFAMRAGGQTVPALTARFAFKRAPLDTNEVSATVTTAPIHFTAAQPPGAENLGNVLSARNLKAEETWQPEPVKTNVVVGTAFTRTIVFTAPDVPGMLFPPFSAGKIDGLGIYLKSDVRDQSTRGVLEGRRQDTVTYFCQRPGQFTIPAASLIWFDLDARELRTNDFPARTINVISNPALASTTASMGANRTRLAQRLAAQWKPFGGLVLAILLIAVACRSTALRHFFARLFAEFLPVHLQPLNPRSHELDSP